MQEVHHKPKEPLQRILDSIHSCLTTKNEIAGESIYCSEWDITITPNIEQCDDRMAVIGFNISDPGFDEPLYECCASTGKDLDSAIGSCVGSFLFAFMNGIALMKSGENGKPVESSFRGKTHYWKSYNSDIVGMGENVDEDGLIATKYWNMLKDEIVKRLGNQKMCYVKVFASKAIGQSDSQVTGEVRINDVPSSELGAIVEKHAGSWNVRQFASQKQFFFIKQDGASESPYSGENGRAVLRTKVKSALELFKTVESKEDYDALYEKLINALGDATLAQECYSFMPEMCAEHAFAQVTYPEMIQICIDGNEKSTYYRNQLADFYPIGHTMFDLFASGAFGDETNDIYRKLIGLSATFGCISQYEAKEGSLDGCAMTALIYNVPKNFEIR